FGGLGLSPAGAASGNPTVAGSFYANGGAFSAGHEITPFARGGIVTRPTLFPMANGMGLMGEAGPEAVMPLVRGPSGKLGVQAHSGESAGANVNVQVHNYSGANVNVQHKRNAGGGVDLHVMIKNEMNSVLNRGGFDVGLSGRMGARLQ